MTSPTAAADAFAEAVRRGNFAEADRLLGELRADVERSWAALSKAQRQSTAAEILEVLRWARRAAIAGRSQMQSRLARIQRGGAYRAAGVAQRRRVEIVA